MKKHSYIFLFTLIIVLVGSLITLWVFQNFEIGLTNDSGWYTFAARFEAGKSFYNEPLVVFAPLYSLLLSSYKISPFTYYQHALLLNLIAYAATLLIWYKISEDFLTKIYRILFISTVGLSVIILMNVWMLWSEAIFIALFSGSVYYFLKNIKKENTTHLLLSSLFLTFAYFERYACLLIVPVFIFFLVSGSLKKPLLNLALFSLPIGAGAVSWMLRNWWLTGNLSSGYEEAVVSFKQNLYELTNTLSIHFLPDEIPYTIRVIITSAVLVWMIMKCQSRSLRFLLILCGSMYLMMLLLNSVKDVLQLFDERYYSTVYIPLVLVFFHTAETTQKTIRREWIKKTIPILMALWMLYPISRTLSNAYNFHLGGIGYHDISWKNNKTIQQLQQVKTDRWFSNDPIPVILLGQTKCLDLSQLSKERQDCYLVIWKKSDAGLPEKLRLEDYSKNFTFTKLYTCKEADFYQAMAHK